MNSLVITIIPNEGVDGLLEAVKKLDEIKDEVRLRAFEWNVDKNFWQRWIIGGKAECDFLTVLISNYH